MLAAAAAAVSFTAQYRMADATRHLPAIAALEAAIPDAAALVFASLGIALALHGRRALRARTLNLASVAASVFAIALAIVLIVTAFAAWAFLPPRYLPGHHARHLSIRLHLRLHPGKGFAHLFSLWLRWGRLAALRRSSRIRPALPLRNRIIDSREHAVFLGRAHYRHRLHVPLEEHLAGR